MALHHATQATELALHMQGFSGASNRMWTEAKLSAIDAPLPAAESEWLEDRPGKVRRDKAA